MDTQATYDFDLYPTGKDIMRRIGVLCDAAAVAEMLWRGCPGEDKGIKTLIRYHHGTVNNLASVERRVAVADYITRRIPSTGSHRDLHERGVWVSNEAYKEVDQLRAKMRRVRS